jgi:hypothetical protein
MNILHQVLHYNQTYNFAFNHDHNFWNILTIKHIWKLEFNIESPHKIQNHFWMFEHIGPFYEVC